MLLDPEVNVSGFERGYIPLCAESTPAHQVNVRFGERLRTLRVERGLSCQQVAGRLVIPVEHLVQFEAGGRIASIVDFETFAQVFKMSVSDLLQGL